MFARLSTDPGLLSVPGRFHNGYQPFTGRMHVLEARTTSGAHEAEVARLRDAYAALPPGAPVRLAKRTSNLFRFRDAKADATAELDVSAFGHVLSVDPVTRTARVGGMTTYEDLCDATLPHQLMPLVVPQLKTITLGGRSEEHTSELQSQSNL